jgi:hypothetical protein
VSGALALADVVEVHHYELPDSTYTLLNTATGLEMELDGSHKLLLSLLDGRYSADQVADRFVAGEDGTGSRGPLAALAQRAMRSTAFDLLLRMSTAGFLVRSAGRE